MKRIAIVGGGIAGLSAAFYLSRARTAGAQVEFVLFESGARLGGVIQTEPVEGCVVEGGPDSFLTEKPWAAQLCRDLGIEAELIHSLDAARKTFILRGGKLVEIPDGLMFLAPTKLWPMLTTPLFSAGAKLKMAREYLFAPRNQGEDAAGDESVAAFVERHFGREMVERMADPLLAGVYGGEARRLSMCAVLPRFVEMERTTGSLSRALRRGKAETKVAARPLFTSLRQGMQQMVDAAAARLAPQSVRLHSPVWTLRRSGSEWRAVTDAGEQGFDAVVLAAPAYKAADLLGTVAEPLAAALREINYSSSITVALGYDEAAIPAELRARVRGFGYLVPRAEAADDGGLQMLACTFVQNKFSHRAPPGRLLFRCFLAPSPAGGGHASTRTDDILHRSDIEVVDAARAQLRAVLGLETEPLFTRISRWPQAMAQYEVGHLERVARIEQLAGELPGLHLIGNAYHGIGVPDCVREGREAAEKLLRA